jgi:hypothetical protein
MSQPAIQISSDKESVARARRILRDRLRDLERVYGVQALWLFGSRVRGEDRPDSDLDVLVELDERPLSLLKFIELENRLSDALGLRVDLVEKSMLKPAIGQRVLSEAVPV